MLHELGATQGAALHLAELVFPFAGQFGRGQLVGAEPPQQGDQGKRLGGRDKLLAVANDVDFTDQIFDDLGAGGRRAEAAAGHRGAELLVVDHLAGAFHG